MGFSVEARVRAALTAWYLARSVDDPDPWGRPDALAEAVEAWLAAPSPERLAQVEVDCAAVAELWEAIIGDQASGSPALQAAFSTAWTVLRPGRPWFVVHALTGAARGVGEEEVRHNVERALLGWLLEGTQA